MYLDQTQSVSGCGRGKVHSYVTALDMQLAAIDEIRSHRMLRGSPINGVLMIWWRWLRFNRSVRLINSIWTTFEYARGLNKNKNALSEVTTITISTRFPFIKVRWEWMRITLIYYPNKIELKRYFVQTDRHSNQTHFTGASLMMTITSIPHYT